MILRIMKLLVSAILSLLILSAFTLVYKFVPVRVIQGSTGSTDYSWKPNSMMNTMEEGFAFLKTDPNGYMNSHYKATSEDIDILMMGSSHVEGVQVTSDENMTFLLNEFLDHRTYNIGISGHNIYTSINNLKNAVEEFNPQKVVIIETSTIELSTNNMDAVVSGNYSEINSISNKFIDAIQQLFPASKRLIISLQSWMNLENRQNNTDKAIPSLDDTYKQSTFDFLASAKDSIGSIDLIIVYHPTYKLMQNGTIAFQHDEDYIRAFEEACNLNDIHFINMTQDFQNLYNNYHILPNGFINTAVGSGHINKHGHRIIAERLAKVIAEDIS